MKKVLAIIAGVVTGFIIVFVGDAVIHALHPMPLGLNYMDKSVMLKYIAEIPSYLLGLMVFFWILSAFTGGIVSALIAKTTEWKSACLSTGGILLAAAMLNLVMTAPSHPLWMWIAALVVLPAQRFIGRLVNEQKKEPGLMRKFFAFVIIIAGILCIVISILALVKAFDLFTQTNKGDGSYAYVFGSIFIPLLLTVFGRWLYRKGKNQWRVKN